MFVTLEDHNGLHERISQLREMEISLDGAICAKGGEVRVHLPYMAACNQTLFNRITGLIKQGKNELNVLNMSLQGVQLMVDYCYSGEMEITEANFEHTIDAALGLEFLNIVEECVEFARQSNANIWCQFLRHAFKHPRLVQLQNFVPNLILENITTIPKDAIIKGLDAAYIAEILEHGTVAQEDRAYAMNIFIEMILAEKGNIQNFKQTIRSMKDIIEKEDELTIEVDVSKEVLLSLVGMCLEIDFCALLDAAVEALTNLPTCAHVISHVLKFRKMYDSSQNVMYLNQYAVHSFKDLPLDTSEDDLCTMLESDSLGQISEFSVLKTVVNWLDKNNANVDTKQRVIGLIRFGLFTKANLEIVISEYDLPGCSDILVSAMKYHMKPFQQPLISENMNKLRICQSQVYIIGGHDAAENLNKIVLVSKVYHKNARQVLSDFDEQIEAPHSFCYSAIADLNCFLFVSGGEGEADCAKKTLYRFDLRSNSWLELASMTSQRKHHTLTAVESACTLMAVGGNDGKRNLDSVEMYDVRTNMWTPQEPLPEGRNQHAAACIDGFLYISGGCHTKTLLCFSDKDWEIKSPMLQVRQTHAMTGVSGMLIVVGGLALIDTSWRELMSTECYDVIQDQWTELSRPKLVCSFGCSVRINNWVYIFGGFSQTNSTRLDGIQRYNIETNEWEVCDVKLPQKMSKMVGFGLTMS